MPTRTTLSYSIAGAEYEYERFGKRHARFWHLYVASGYLYDDDFDDDDDDDDDGKVHDDR